MSKIRVGVQLPPQHTTYASYAQAVRDVESLGVDTIFNWDHFFPLSGDPQGNHFEAMTLLTAIATLTTRAEIGTLVTCNSYRNPALLSNMAKTIDHISGGRLILGIGAGWCERDYAEFGYTFGAAPDRLRALGQALPIITQRWQVDVPAPVRNPIPIMIGGGGEQVTLKLTAKYASIWNFFDRDGQYKHKNQVLNEWCEKVGRNPAEIERSMTVFNSKDLDKCVEAGATHIIMGSGEPWNMDAVEELVEWRDKQNRD